MRKRRSAAGDKQTDCAACEVGNHVEYFVDAGRDADALAEAKPLFGRKMKCREVPNNTFSRLLLPLLSAGHVKEAAACQREVVKFICDSRQFIAYQADHLIFYSLTGQATKAVKLLEARLPWAMETRNGRARFRFLLGSRLVLARLHAEGRASVPARPRNPARLPRRRRIPDGRTGRLVPRHRPRPGAPSSTAATATTTTATG